MSSVAPVPLPEKLPDVALMLVYRPRKSEYAYAIVTIPKERDPFAVLASIEKKLGIAATEEEKKKADARLYARRREDPQAGTSIGEGPTPFDREFSAERAATTPAGTAAGGAYEPRPLGEFCRVCFRTKCVCPPPEHGYVNDLFNGGENG